VLKLVLPFMCKSVYSHDQVQNASSSLVETDVDFATGLQDIDLRSFARLYLSRTGPSFWGRAVPKVVLVVRFANIVAN
jgi:hypothetical protein